MSKTGLFYACFPAHNAIKSESIFVLFNQNSEYEQLLSRQQQLRQNLGALGKSDREAAIRDQILDDLESSENRRRELEAEIAKLATPKKSTVTYC